VNTFKKIGLDTGFYFSYTYDLTRSLQENILRKVVKQEKMNRTRSQSAETNSTPLSKSGDGADSVKPKKS
jgi:hypothetical protein